MNEDEAIEILKHVNIVRKFSGIYSSTETIHKAIETILAELEKKDKIIELMIKHLCNVIDNDSDASLLPFYDSDDNLEAKVKKYFERRAEDDRR